MTRTGRKDRACFRVGAFDARTRRDGSCLEILGHYEPGAVREEEKLVLKGERIKHWLSVGARPSEKVAALLRARGLIEPQTRKRGKKKAKK